MRPSEALSANRKSLREIAARHRVRNLRFFGSALHGTDTAASDLDLLVDPTPETTLMDLSAIQVEAELLLGVPVDVLTPRSLPVRVRQRVLAEAESV